MKINKDEDSICVYQKVFQIKKLEMEAKTVQKEQEKKFQEKQTKALIFNETNPDPVKFTFDNMEIDQQSSFRNLEEMVEVLEAQLEVSRIPSPNDIHNN